MCGIVAAASNRNVVPILLDGLNRLEYRGYDSAGIALVENNKILRIRKQGKVSELHKTIKKWSGKLIEPSYTKNISSTLINIESIFNQYI